MVLYGICLSISGCGLSLGKAAIKSHCATTKSERNSKETPLELKMELKRWPHREGANKTITEFI